MSCRKYYDGICQGGICEKCIDDPKNEHMRRRRTIRNTLLFMSIIMIVGLALVMLSGDGEARLAVWDGDGADALASTAANWDTDTAPIAGDDILFDGLNATGDDACTWDLATNSFGTFTIGAGYSGTITQSSDMHITGYSQAGGVFTGSVSKWVYCSGNFIKSSGTITAQILRLQMVGDGQISIASSYFYQLIIDANVTVSTGFSINRDAPGAFTYLEIKPDRTLTLNAGITFYCFRANSVIKNSGYINGSQGISIYDGVGYSSTAKIDLGITSVFVTFYRYNAGAADSVFNLNSSFSCSVLTIQSVHASYTCTLNLNGHSLTATTITVGTRGILDCGNGTITCSALTSTSGTITEDTATWIFNDGAVVTATSGEKFYNVQMKGDCDFVNAVNVTNELRWIDVPTEYGALDVYLDSIYSQTIPTYTFGPEQTAAAEYSYLPDVQISMSQFYEDIDFSVYAYITTNLPVTYNITGTSSSWLTYHEGRITGMPPEIGNYTYTITATHESGSIDIINGYILVGSLSTAEYSYDQIWGLILWIVITAFMLIGLLLNIPLIQIVAFMGTIGSIVASLRIPEFEVFLMIFALGNSVLFFIGMVRYRR